jgi:hypothetical protein
MPKCLDADVTMTSPPFFFSILPRPVLPSFRPRIYLHPLAGGGVDWRHFQLYSPLRHGILGLADELDFVLLISIFFESSTHLTCLLCFDLLCTLWSFSAG